MKTSKIKICGITNIDDAVKIVELGVDYVGMIINVPFSPRSIDKITAAEISAAAKRASSSVKVVGVFVNENLVEACETIDFCHLDVAQLHGNESPAYCSALRDAVEVWKAVVVNSRRDVEMSEKYRASADMVVFDAGYGNGLSIDFSLLTGVEVDVLAGGLGLSNIVDAIRKIKPDVVDINTAVESAPGVKDINLVKSIINKINTDI